jgi:S-methylmethionine-dependent homocysteine/selenocysteine methylase
MARYRAALPQMSGGLFLTDGGQETTLIFHMGLELPEFAAFPLLDTEAGRRTLRDYFRPYAELARQHAVGLILESATWRASPDWAEKLGYSSADLERLNRAAIEQLVEIRSEYEGGDLPLVISGCIGPRGDGYSPEQLLSTEEAERYHAAQIAWFRDTDADLATAMTMTHVEEAIGIVRAGRTADMPVVISFTVETDGRLPSGQSLREAIGEVDEATGSGPSYYMINCAHPSHFDHVLEPGAPWLERIRGLRANASKLSHAELDEATELDEGNPVELGRQYVELRTVLKSLNVLGGCCGTDDRHVDAVLTACLAEEGNQRC